MKTKHTLYLLISVTLLLSCQNGKRQRQDAFSLKKANEKLTFPLNSSTKSSINVLHLFTDSSGKEYLTFQSPGQNDILFYNMNTQEFEFKVKPEVEGNNGVGFYTGYYIHSIDSIFITKSGVSEIALINREAEIINKFPYGKSDDGIVLSGYNAISFLHKPVIFIDDKLYILPYCDRWAEKNPVCASIDINNNRVQAFVGFEYPAFEGMTNQQKKSGLENDFSRCYNGNQFVYAFFYDENIYITSPNHNYVKQKNIKSKYISEVKLLSDYGVSEKEMCENPNYGNLIYDKYRNVYYRIAYPETTIDKNIRMLELLMYGRKNFSIIIMDEDFNIIGETLFADYLYNSSLLFVHEDGLYISDSHFLNPDFSDDILSFQRFELVESMGI